MKHFKQSLFNLKLRPYTQTDMVMHLVSWRFRVSEPKTYLKTQQITFFTIFLNPPHLNVCGLSPLVDKLMSGPFSLRGRTVGPGVRAPHVETSSFETKKGLKDVKTAMTKSGLVQ